jgi:hypothetical protein
MIFFSANGESTAMGDDELKNLKIAPDLHKRVKAFAASHGISLQEITERSLIATMGEAAPPPASAPPAPSILDGKTKSQREALEMFAELLASGDEAELVEAVRRTIIALHRRNRASK